MKRWLLPVVGLVLAVGPTAAFGQETRWRPASGATPPPAASTPTVSLRQPVPVPDPAPADSGFRPASFSPAPIVRAKNGDPPIAAAPLGSEVAPSPRLVPSPLSFPNSPVMVAPGGAGSRVTSDGTSFPPTIAPGMMMGSGFNGDCGPACPIDCGDPCCPLDCGGCCPWTCCPTGCSIARFWISGEYLLWSLKPMQAPPLVTAGPRTQPPEFGGALGFPGTQVLYGGGDLQNDIFSGGRFTLGVGFPCLWDLGFESTFFFLGQRTSQFTAGTSTTDQVVARPFTDFDPALPQPTSTSQLVQYPGLVNGNVTVTSTTQLWGIEGNFRKPLWCGCFCRIDCLAGFRYLNLEDTLNIREDLLLLPEFGSTAITVNDRFSTQNQFYGGQLGLDGEVKLWGRWYLGSNVKVAVGNMHQTINIAGSQAFAFGPPTGTITTDTGIFALGTNSGTVSRDKIAVIPEVGVKLGYQITDHCRIFAGYNFLYVSDVVRAGDQVDLRLNTTQIQRVFGPQALVGTPVPQPLFQSTSFWAHGATFGMELKY